MSVELKGMTWDHPRGYDPLVATSAAYAKAHPGVSIAWEKRSLQAFADFPVEQLAAEYDLIVIDHPHVGFVAAAGCLVAFDGFPAHRDDLAELAAQSLGGSHESYQFGGRQWALAIDAATQVACYRPDLLSAAPQTWNEVIELAKEGRVVWPIKPVDALMSFFTLSANCGTPCRTNSAPGEALLRREDALAVLDLLESLARHIPRQCPEMNPIQAYERLSAAGNRQFAYCPLGYGYTNYSRAGFRPHLLKFTDIAETLPGAGPRGSAIGGTGIAVSSRSKNIAVAVDYACWIASADCQRGLYFDAGGQPANAAAWDDVHCNAATLDFFSGTRRTLDNVYVRPRYDGYLGFQDAGGTIINAFLRGQCAIGETADRLEAAYQRSLRP
jgi:multiple sugar transport system substrate-binding protein